jgi:hypothetical protein
MIKFIKKRAQNARRGLGTISIESPTNKLGKSRDGLTQ